MTTGPSYEHARLVGVRLAGAWSANGVSPNQRRFLHWPRRHRIVLPWVRGTSPNLSHAPRKETCFPLPHAWRGATGMDLEDRSMQPINVRRIRHNDADVNEQLAA